MVNTSLPHNWAWESGVLIRLLHLNQPRDRDDSAPIQIQVCIYCLWSMSTASELVSLHLLPVISNPMKRFGQLPAAYRENHHHHLPFKVLNKEAPPHSDFPASMLLFTVSLLPGMPSPLFTRRCSTHLSIPSSNATSSTNLCLKSPTRNCLRHPRSLRALG